MPSNLRHLLLSAVFLSGAMPACAQEVDHLQAFLLARGEDYYIHALPLSEGHVLVYSIPSSGVMKPFFLAGPKADALAHRAAGAPPQADVRIAGLAADSQRLYVLAREQSATRLAADVAHAPASAGPDRFYLYVFWQQDASLLHQQPVEPSPEEATTQTTLGRGPLTLLEGGVGCFGTELSFDGRTLTNIRTPDGRSFTPPPPDLFDRRQNL